MKILSLLKTYDGDTLLKVGAIDGTGFFYCGTVADFRENVYKYDEQTKKRAINLRDKALEKLNDLLENPLTLASYAKAQLKKESRDLSFEGFRIEANMYLRAVDARYRTLEQRRERARYYVPLTARDVKDYAMCDKTVESGNCLRVTLSGYETGAYWTTTETATLPSVMFANTDLEEEDG